MNDLLDLLEKRDQSILQSHQGICERCRESGTIPDGCQGLLSIVNGEIVTEVCPRLAWHQAQAKKNLLLKQSLLPPAYLEQTVPLQPREQACYNQCFAAPGYLVTEQDSATKLLIRLVRWRIEEGDRAIYLFLPAPGEGWHTHAEQSFNDFTAPLIESDFLALDQWKSANLIEWKWDRLGDIVVTRHRSKRPTLLAGPYPYPPPPYPSAGFRYVLDNIVQNVSL